LLFQSQLATYPEKRRGEKDKDAVQYELRRKGGLRNGSERFHCHVAGEGAPSARIHSSCLRTGPQYATDIVLQLSLLRLIILFSLEREVLDWGRQSIIDHTLVTISVSDSLDRFSVYCQPCLCGQFSKRGFCVSWKHLR
jgi:hypothetical protein